MAATVPKADIKDIAYQIIAGYYPDIASGMKYVTGSSNAGIGKSGSTGAKYKLKEGFSDASINRARMAEVVQQTQTGTGADKVVNWKKRAKAMAGLQGTDVLGVKGEGAKVEYGPQTIRGGDTITSWQWKGGSQKYRLYGDMVWYMHGLKKKNLLLEYLRQKDKKGDNVFGDKIPPFAQVYKDTEPELQKVASALAKEFFRKSLNKKIMNEFFEGSMGSISKKLKAGGQTQEEMGYSTENFEYMSFAEAKAKGLVDEKSKYSKANDRDMVKINKKTRMVESILDVTEMGATELGHGMVEGDSETSYMLDEVIADIDPDDNDSLNTVARALEMVFMNAINSEFNPTIRYLKEYAAKQGVKKGVSFDDIMKQVQDDMKKATIAAGKEMKVDKHGNEIIPKVSVANLALNSGLQAVDEAGKAIFRDMVEGGKASQEGLSYIVHMLATMGADTRYKYQQAHRVADVPGGESVYAIIPLRQFAASNQKRGLEFDENLSGKAEMLVGYSATLALEVASGEITRLQAKNIMQAQKRNFMYTRVNGPNHNGRNSALGATANNLRSTSTMRTTTASYVGTKQLDKFFAAIMDTIRADPREMNKAIKEVLSTRMFGWDPTSSRAGKRLNKAKWENKTQFWALPYVGIQHSEHAGEE
jgi:hypothetical protein